MTCQVLPFFFRASMFELWLSCLNDIAHRVSLVTGGTIVIGRALDMHLLAIHEPLLRTRKCVAPCIVYSVQCTVYSVQCTVYVDVVGL